jgi:hypothetical protein
MLTAPGSPIPPNFKHSRLNAKARRAVQVISLGLMNRAATCAPAIGSDGLPVNTPVPVNPSLLSANSMPAFFPTPFNLFTGPGVAPGTYGPGIDATVPLPVAAQIYQAQQPGAQALHQTSSLTPQVQLQGGAGASIGDFSNAPDIVPMNLTPDMVQTPQMRRQKRQRSSNNPRSQGVQWGGLPSVSPQCAAPGSSSFAASLKANPWAALFIASGLSVIVYSVVKK